jgi:hypothetical protein
VANQLHYHGTTVEVKLGDRVVISRFLRRPQYGVVCYLPGASAPHPEMRDEDGSQDWAIELENGSVLVWPYVPAELQPSRKIRFVQRAEPGYTGLQPTTKIGLIPDQD